MPSGRSGEVSGRSQLQRRCAQCWRKDSLRDIGQLMTSGVVERRRTLAAMCAVLSVTGVYFTSSVLCWEVCK